MNFPFEDFYSKKLFMSNLQIDSAFEQNFLEKNFNPTQVSNSKPLPYMIFFTHLIRGLSNKASTNTNTPSKNE